MYFQVEQTSLNQVRFPTHTYSDFKPALNPAKAHSLLNSKMTPVQKRLPGYMVQMPIVHICRRIAFIATVFFA
jgi:hypothetical protein